MEDKINSVLESIGLNKNEIKVYLCLVGCSSSTALEVSKKTGIHRSNTYDSLRSLVDKGFITEIINDNKKMFNALDPEKIQHYLVQKQQEVSAIIPQLKRSVKKDEDHSLVRTAKGVFGAREAMNDLLKMNAPIKAFGAPKEIIDILGLGFLKEFHKNRIKKKIWMHHIYNSDAAERVKILNKLNYTDANYLDKKYDSRVVTLICKDTVVYFVLSSPVMTIILKDEGISESFSHYFDALLKRTKK